MYSYFVHARPTMRAYMQFPSSRASVQTRRSSLGTLVDQSTVLLMVAIGTLILLLALMILFHENANATKGYRLRTLEYERAQLHLEEEVLKMRVAQEQSIQTLQNDTGVQAMVTPKKVTYLEATHSVAIRTEAQE